MPERETQFVDGGIDGLECFQALCVEIILIRHVGPIRSGSIGRVREDVRPDRKVHLAHPQLTLRGVTQAIIMRRRPVGKLAFARSDNLRGRVGQLADLGLLQRLQGGTGQWLDMFTVGRLKPNRRGCRPGTERHYASNDEICFWKHDPPGSFVCSPTGPPIGCSGPIRRTLWSGALNNH